MNLVRSQNLTVAGVVVHQDAQGRYSLNDLHRASGEEDRHKPVQFLRLASTEALVREIEKVGNPTFNAVSSVPGRNGGTFVCKELIYVYAHWISPDFYLNVIRTYDALVTDSYHPFQPSGDLFTPEQMKQLYEMMEAISIEQMDESIADVFSRLLPSMIRDEIANTQISDRRGLTAGECWKIQGLPTKGLRGYSNWLSQRLLEIGCCISNGPSMHASNATRLFDPDRVSAIMRLGFKATCEQYVRKRLGQNNIFVITK
jgi:hypothetical protein